MIKRLMHTDSSFASVRASGFRHFLDNHKHKSSSDAMQSVATRRRNEGGGARKGDEQISSEKSENNGDNFVPGALLSEGGLKYRPEVFKAPESNDDHIEKMMKIDPGWLDFSAPKAADDDDDEKEDNDGFDDMGNTEMPPDAGEQTNTGDETVTGQLTKSAKSSVVETLEEVDVSLGDTFNYRQSTKNNSPAKAVVFNVKSVKQRSDGADVDELSLSAREGQPWKLLRHFRDAYLYIAPLRKKMSTRHFFVADYVPRPQITAIKTATAKTGLSAQDLVPACHKIEYSYFNIDQHFVPRLLLPSSPLYWIVTDLVNYLHLKVSDNICLHRLKSCTHSVHRSNGILITYFRL
jgi:hypothetical protein